MIRTHILPKYTTEYVIFEKDLEVIEKLERLFLCCVITGSSPAVVQAVNSTSNVIWECLFYRGKNHPFNVEKH